MNIYYVYEYLRKDLTPYYVGKGKGNRWREKHSVVVPPKERVRFVAINLTEQEAFALEKTLIEKYGRKDLKTGILRNLTTGGEGASPGPIVRKKLSLANEGKKPWNFGKTYKCKNNSGARSKSKSGANHPQYGKSRTEDECKKISKGISETWNRPLLSCPHCGKQGKQNMTRWHFNNCKNIKY